MPGRRTAPRKSRQPRREQPARPATAAEPPATPAPTIVLTGERSVGAPTSERFLPWPARTGEHLGRPEETRTPMIRISDAYRRVLDCDVRPGDLARPKTAVKRAFELLADRRGLKMADLLARSVINRALDGKARDAIAAMREITDRTEGPVVQKSQVVSARYVVSVSPTGALSEAQPAALSLSDWEAQAVEEDARATAKAIAEANLTARDNEGEG